MAEKTKMDHATCAVKYRMHVQKGRDTHVTPTSEATEQLYGSSTLRRQSSDSANDTNNFNVLENNFNVVEGAYVTARNNG